MWHDPKHEPVFSEYLELDLSDVVPSIAGPKRPQDRIALSDAKSAFRKDIPNYVGDDTRQAGVHEARRGRRGDRSRPATRASLTVTPTTRPRAVGRRALEGPAEQPGAGEVRGVAASSCSTTARW